MAGVMLLFLAPQITVYERIIDRPLPTDFVKVEAQYL
jgi:hypothetical protein